MTTTTFTLVNLNYATATELVDAVDAIIAKQPVSASLRVAGSTPNGTPQLEVTASSDRHVARVIALIQAVNGTAALEF